MILQASDPIILELVKMVGVPLAQVLGALWFIRKYVLAPANGAQSKEIAVAVAERLAASQRGAAQHQDAILTEQFDQLRRDLSTTIEKATENSIMRYLWEAERRKNKR